MCREHCRNESLIISHFGTVFHRKSPTATCSRLVPCSVVELCGATAFAADQTRPGRGPRRAEGRRRKAEGRVGTMGQDRRLEQLGGSCTLFLLTCNCVAAFRTAVSESEPSEQESVRRVRVSGSSQRVVQSCSTAPSPSGLASIGRQASSETEVRTSNSEPGTRYSSSLSL